ncbi:hypothetical protein [Faecalibacterium sp.]|uniref:hypothetical protein n=1 Tax=Faecalibacterium sp. TaxID=1971605 RepID=UPI003999A1B4
MMFSIVALLYEQYPKTMHSASFFQKKRRSFRNAAGEAYRMSRMALRGGESDDRTGGHRVTQEVGGGLGHIFTEGVGRTAQHGEEVALAVAGNAEPILGLRDAPDIAGSQNSDAHDGDDTAHSAAAGGVGHLIFGKGGIASGKLHIFLHR